MSFFTFLLTFFNSCACLQLRKRCFFSLVKNNVVFHCFFSRYILFFFTRVKKNSEKQHCFSRFNLNNRVLGEFSHFWPRISHFGPRGRFKMSTKRKKVTSSIARSLNSEVFCLEKKTRVFVAFGLEFGFDSLKIALKTRFARYESDF